MKLNLVVVLALFLAGSMEVQAAALQDETIRDKNDALAADHEDTAESGAYEDEYDEAREEFHDIDINSDGFIDRGELQAMDNHALEPEQIQEFFETREGCVQTYGVGSTAVGCGLAPWAAWQARLRPGFMWAAAGTCLYDVNKDDKVSFEEIVDADSELRKEVKL